MPDSGANRSAATPFCDFCRIALHRSPARIRYEDSELIVFRNLLRWAPVMLLVAPKRHMLQEEFWRSELFPQAARLAIQLGYEDCPGGFRVLSNFGRDALQTQEHGHLHLMGGGDLGFYVRPEEPKGPYPPLPNPEEG